MKVALIADCYTPMRSSAAIMLEDLAIEFKSSGHDPIVIIPDSSLTNSISQSIENNFMIIRVRVPSIKDVGYFQRTINELIMPFIILKELKKINSLYLDLEGIIWYSPSIFHGPLIKILKKKNKCKTYLILRDIFPEWALNTGVMRKGLPYYFFKIIESYQYNIATTIGIQSPSNINYFKKKMPKYHSKVEVLHNWISNSTNFKCSLSIKDTSLVGRKIFVYAGNMGLAQGMSGIMNIVKELDKIRPDIGFLFIGRGSESKKYREEVIKFNLKNILVKDEIESSEIPGLYAQCSYGLVFLDPRHETHNIPGKFISYMRNGLPVIACINKGNDLFDIIQENKVGKAFEGIPHNKVKNEIMNMVDNISARSYQINRCNDLASSLFSPKVAVSQIIKAIDD